MPPPPSSTPPPSAAYAGVPGVTDAGPHEYTLLARLPGTSLYLERLDAEDVISSRGLKELRRYRYSGTDNSLIYNYIFSPALNRAVYLLPEWVAPNVVTLVGFAIFVGAYLYTALDAMTLRARRHGSVGGGAGIGGGSSWLAAVDAADLYNGTPASSTTALVMAAGILIYQTLDNTDGKQARRTGSSSPLGELFDHVCDALAAVLLMSSLALVFGLSATTTNAVVAVSVATFHFSHWEEYFTGSLILGYITSPTEVLVSLWGLMTVHAFSPSLLAGPLPLPAFLGAALGDDWRLLDGLVAAVVTASLTACVMNTVEVVRWARRTSTPLAATLPTQAPFFVFGLVFLAFGFAAPDVHRAEPLVHVAAMTFAFGYTQMRLIVQRITREPAVLFYYHQLVVGAAAVLAATTDVDHALLMHVVAAACAIAFFTCAHRVAMQICGELDIEVFRIRPKK